MIRQTPIGKQVQSTIYVHRAYMHNAIPTKLLCKASSIASSYMQHLLLYNIVKWDKYNNKISFIYSPDFDDIEEPGIETVCTVDLNSEIVRTRNYWKSSNRPIYHHKWLMVGDDYTGFDISLAKKRSEDIEETIKKHNIDKRLIGYKKYWEEVVMPIIHRERQLVNA